MPYGKYRSGVYAKKARKAGRKAAYKGGRMVKQRYSGKSAIPNLLKDVTMLKHLVNVEKKRFDVTLTNSAAVSLTFGGATGAYSAIVSPTPSEGVSNNERIGNSIKLVSAMMNLRFSQQASALNPIDIKWFLVCRPDNGSGISATTSLSHFLEVNPFTTQRDYHSNRDAEYFSSMKVVASGVAHLKQDQITGGTGVVQRKVPLRLNYHLKYNTDTSTLTTKNQMYLFAVASEGDQALSTGALIQYNIRWYYTDN